MIYILGIGPGSTVDYLTVKAHRVLAFANLIIYIGEMIGEDIIAHCNSKAEIIIKKKMPVNELQHTISINYKLGNKIAILMPGDPSLYSGQFMEQHCLQEHISWMNSQNFHYEIIPGISSLSALCSLSSIDITSFNRNQSIFISSIERLRDLDSFSEEKMGITFATQPNVVLFQSIRDWDYIYHLLIKKYPLNTEVIFAYKVSWVDEKILKTNLKDSCDVVMNNKINKHSLILILPK